MGPRIDERFELNEAAWWSNWADETWPSRNTYLLRSIAFPESFFNRMTFIGMGAEWRRTLSKIELNLEEGGMQACVHLPRTAEFSPVRRELSSRGYALADEMRVMRMRTPTFRVNPMISVMSVTLKNAKEWCIAYLKSFYDTVQLIDSTLAVVRKTVRRPGANLIAAVYDGLVVGTMAIFRTGKIFGIYCVGTIPHFRKKGVANTMLSFANSISREAGAIMVLQTLVSDENEHLYHRMGFVTAYSKEIFERHSVRKS